MIIDKNYKMENFFIKADEIADLIPGVSTISNVVNVILKSFVVPSHKATHHPYFRCLADKSYTTCAISAIPLTPVVKWAATLVWLALAGAVTLAFSIRAIPR